MQRGLDATAEGPRPGPQRSIDQHLAYTPSTQPPPKASIYSNRYMTDSERVARYIWRHGSHATLGSIGEALGLSIERVAELLTALQREDFAFTGIPQFPPPPPP